MIAGPSILSAPSGKTYVRGRRPGTVNAVIHELLRRPLAAIHDLSAAVEKPVENTRDPTWRAAGQPPIANISIRGRLDVASERSSE